MQTLEQTLSEIEPILQGTDGTFQFTHLSFQEVLTAKQFAYEINSGALSVKDAYEQFWSYEEDAKLWGLPKDREWRALLPDWEPILLNMATRLIPKNVEELDKVLINNYEEFEMAEWIDNFGKKELDKLSTTKKYKEFEKKLETRKKRYYNVFCENLFFASKVAGSFKNKKKIDITRIQDALFRLGKYGADTEYVRKAYLYVKGIKKIPRRYIRSENLVKLFTSIDATKVEPYYGKKSVNFLTLHEDTKKEHEIIIAGRIVKPSLEEKIDEKVVPFLIKKINNAKRKIDWDYASKSLIYLLYGINITKRKINMYNANNIANSLLRLGEIGNQEALDFLIQYLQEVNPYRVFAVIALGKTKSEKAVPALIEYMNDKRNKDYRHFAAASLGKTKSEKAVPALIEYMRNETNPMIIGVVAASLVYIGSEKAVPALIECLYDKKNFLRGYLVSALGIIGNKTAIKPLKDLLIDSTLGDISYEAILSIHQRLKPPGYIAPELFQKVK